MSDPSWNVVRQDLRIGDGGRFGSETPATGKHYPTFGKWRGLLVRWANFSNHARILMSYEPGPLKHPVHMYRPAIEGVLAEASGQELDKHLGWDKLLGNCLTSERSLGDHFNMMVGDNARRLARAVEKRLAAERAG